MSATFSPFTRDFVKEGHVKIISRDKLKDVSCTIFWHDEGPLISWLEDKYLILWHGNKIDKFCTVLMCPVCGAYPGLPPEHECIVMKMVLKVWLFMISQIELEIGFYLETQSDFTSVNSFWRSRIKFSTLLFLSSMSVIHVSRCFLVRCLCFLWFLLFFSNVKVWRLRFWKQKKMNREF